MYLICIFAKANRIKYKLYIYMYDIKKAVKQKGYTLKTIAECLDISLPALSQQIKDNTIALRRVQEIADIIGCPLSDLIDDKINDFASYIRYKGIHYTADNIKEFFKQVEEIKSIAK